MTRVSIYDVHNYSNYPSLNFKNIRAVGRIAPENYSSLYDGMKIWILPSSLEICSLYVYIDFSTL